MQTWVLRLSAILTLLVVATLATVHHSLGKFQPPGVTSGDGYHLDQSREGVPVIISRGFWNSKNVDQEITVVFDVRMDDISVYVTSPSDVVSPLSQIFISAPWVPEIPGEYDIRAFILSNFTKPEVLEPVTVAARFTVLSNKEYIALYSDRPTSLTLTPVAPVETSHDIANIIFNEKQFLGNGFNRHISEISTSANGIFIIGIGEVPPLRENPPKSGGNELIFFASSNDKGSTFEPMQYLVNNSRALIFTRHAQVHPVNDTLVYASWLQQEPYRDEFKLVVSKSFDGGRAFSNTIKLDHAGIVFGDLDVAVSKNGKSIYTLRTEVYRYGEPMQSALIFSKSDDYANSFTPKQIILNSTNNEYLDCTQIAIQEADRNQATHVYLTWRQNFGDHLMKVVFSSSHDNGVTFTPAIVIRETYAENSDCPIFATYGTNVYLAWQETKLIYKPEDPSQILVGDSDIFFVASHDSGRTFESPLNLSEGIGTQTIEPRMLVSDGRIYVVWRDTIPEIDDEGRINYYGNAEIIITRSLDGGQIFEKPANLSNNPTGSYAPEITALRDNLYVVWKESDFPSNDAVVSFKMSTDAGNTYSDLTGVVSNMPEEFIWPVILTSADSQVVYFIWFQTNDANGVELYVTVGTLSR